MSTEAEQKELKDWTIRTLGAFKLRLEEDRTKYPAQVKEAARKVGFIIKGDADDDN